MQREHEAIGPAFAEEHEVVVELVEVVRAWLGVGVGLGVRVRS